MKRKRMILLVAGLALLLCCGGTLVWYAVDTGLRQSGALPTYTPAPTDTPRPTATIRPTRTSRPTAMEPPTVTPRPSTNTPLPPTATDEPTIAPQRAAPTIAVVPAMAGSDQGLTCDKCIKGNINSDGKKIYHLPICPSYNATKIDPTKGERMFSSEAEAQAAGWSKANNCP